jgi:periplasmic divalent cation tolerance protein
MTDASDAIVVFISCADRDEAIKLAEMLVEERVAACVQVLPEVESIFYWQENMERQPEVLILAKTMRARFDELETRVRELHSYETPEIIACPIAAVSAPYLDWLQTSVEAQGSSSTGEYSSGLDENEDLTLNQL